VGAAVLAGFGETGSVLAAAALGVALDAVPLGLSTSCVPLVALLLVVVAAAVTEVSAASAGAAADVAVAALALLSEVGVPLAAAAVVGVTGCVEMFATDWLHFPLVRRVPKDCSCPKGCEACCAACEDNGLKTLALEWTLLWC